MSHLSQVKVRIQDRSVLLEVLREMHLRCIGEVDSSYEFASNFNQCDVIAVARGNHCLGFRFEGGEASIQHNLDEYEFEKIRQELLQRYSVKLIKKSVEEEGRFSIQSEEKMPDGSIKITVSRWI